MRCNAPRLRILISAVILLAAMPASAFVWPGSSPWPDSSDHPVVRLPHPTVTERVVELGSDLANGFRLVAFGDQRALAHGEWQAMVAFIAAQEAQDSAATPLLAVLDTGDIIADGRRTDQFHMLSEILAPLRDYPYLVTVGNHEVHNHKGSAARRHTVTALAASDADLNFKKLWRRYDLPMLRLILLDTNDLVYGPSGHEGEVTDHPRVRNQLTWLVETLAETDVRPVVVALHHPPVSSAKMHRHAAADLWSLRWQGRTLMEILADGGVDLVLTGHTHTYERFRLRSPAGNSLHVVNVSGRPRDSAFWWGSGRRRARDWSTDTIDELAAAGWRDLDGWEITQQDAMLDDQQNQWAMLHVTPDGRLGLEMFYLVDKGETYRREDLVWLDEDTAGILPGDSEGSP